MSDREQAVNQDLQILGDAYRLGQIQRDEYRARRRHVLAGLSGASDADTTRKPLKAGQRTANVHDRNGAAHGNSSPLSPPMGAGNAPRSVPPAAPRRAGVAWKSWLLFACILVLVAAVAVLLLKAPDEAPAAATAPAATATPLAAVEASASTFVARDDWQASAVDDWLAAWQRVDPALRRQALSRPALQQLRDQAGYQLTVRKALDAPDAGGNERESLERMLQMLDPSS